MSEKLQPYRTHQRKHKHFDLTGARRTTQGEQDYRSTSTPSRDLTPSEIASLQQDKQESSQEIRAYLQKLSAATRKH